MEKIFAVFIGKYFQLVCLLTNIPSAKKYCKRQSNSLPYSFAKMFNKNSSLVSLLAGRLKEIKQLSGVFHIQSFQYEYIVISYFKKPSHFSLYDKISKSSSTTKVACKR